LLDQLLVAYGHLPHHPGKGKVYDRLLPLVKGTWRTPRLRTRFGVCFECDLNDKLTRYLYYQGLWRRDCRILARLIKPGQVIIDAGANIGYFAFLFAKWMRGNGIVHAFEPFPGTAMRFERNLALNPRLQPVIRLHRSAISDFVGRTTMCAPDQGNQGCNFLNPAGETEVSVTTLDAFCESERLTRVDMIKIDVEGSEVALLRGAEETIRRFHPVLMIEVNPSTLQNFGCTARDLIEAIGRYGYRLHYSARFGLKPLERLPVYGEEPNVFAFPIL
jgi:FkbM family methyltransferase